MIKQRSRSSAYLPMAFDPKIFVLAAAAMAVIMGLYLALDGDEILGMALVVLGAAFGTGWYTIRAVGKRVRARR
jgi:hypothetical protein